HLVSRFLATGPQRFTGEALADWFERARGRLVEMRCTLDPALANADTNALASERIRWLERKGLIARTDSGWKNLWPQDSPPGWRRPARLVRYFDNALDDHLRSLAPGAELHP
ncbi:MAG: hypothetical protein L0I62_10835, partial [Gammaproteobacteria bacterium]|nr:hypothetical protein [Gammaproteobacteria bacterium]